MASDPISPLTAQNGDFLSLDEISTYGKAPGVKSKLLSKNGGQEVYAVIFEIGDEIATGLAKFATEKKIEAAHFTGIGAANDLKLAWYNLSKKEYKVIIVDEDTEVLSLLGNIGVLDGKPIVHCHIVVGLEDGRTVGGHLLHGTVKPTLEVIVTVEPSLLKKVYNPEVGLPLFSL